MAANKLGIASEDTWPFRFETTGLLNEYDKEITYTVGTNDRPPNAAYDEARGFHAVEYCRLDPDHTTEAEQLLRLEEKAAVGVITLARLKQSLAEGYPVSFAFWYYKEIPWATDSKPEDDYISLREIPDDKRHTKHVPAKDWEGHSVIAVGFDPSRNRVLCQNSWGPYSKSARFWMPYSWIRDFEATKDFWMLRLLDQSPLETANKRADALPEPSSHVALSDPKAWTVTPVFGAGKVALGYGALTVAPAVGDRSAHVVWTGANRSVVDIYRYGLDAWSSFTVRSDSTAAAARSAVAAVVPSPGRLHVVWIAPDGAVNGEFIHQRDPVAYVPTEVAPAGSAEPGAGLAAVSRHEGAVDVWWVTPNGSIEWANRLVGDAGEGKWTRNTLCPAGSAAPKASLAAVADEPDSPVLFWVGPDRTVQVARYYPGKGKWERESFAKPYTPAEETRIAVASSGPGDVQAFWLTATGQVRGLAWSRELGGWEDQRVLDLEESSIDRPRARVDSGLAAVHVGDSGVHVVYVAADNSVHGLRRGDGGAWVVYHIAEAGSVSAGTPVGAFTYKYDKVGELSIVVASPDERVAILTRKTAAR